MTEMCIEMQHFSVFVYSMARSELALHTFRKLSGGFVVVFLSVMVLVSL